MKLILRFVVVLLSLLVCWQALVSIFNLPPFILPSPTLVAKTFYLHANSLTKEAFWTFLETVLGLSLGIIFGLSTALLIAFFKPFRFWFLPILIISQAIPTFAIAPLLVIWFGYGMASKIITTVIMLYFPITSSFYDGLRRTERGWLDLAKTMQAPKWRIFWNIRIPAALPHLASGIRVATVIAPIGAIIGEWVGASHGLGYLMLNSNARMQIDLMFASLITIIVFSLLLYFVVDQLLSRVIFWDGK